MTLSRIFSAAVLAFGCHPVDRIVRRRVSRKLGRDWPGEAGCTYRAARSSKRRRRRMRGRAKAMRRAGRRA